MPTLNPADLVAQAVTKARQYAERGSAELHYLRKVIESGALKLESPQMVAAMVGDIARWGEIGMIPAVNARRTPHRVAIVDDEGTMTFRELDDAVLDIRFNELDTAAIVFKSEGDPEKVLAYEEFLDANADQWLTREIRGFWKRVLKRIDLTSRSLVALVEPGSCFVGTLAELVFAADRSYMLIGSPEGDNRPPATIACASPALIAWAASMTALSPEPQTLLTVTAEIVAGTPAASIAWRAGAWPTPPCTTFPMMTSFRASGATPARSMAARMATAPSCGADKELNAPRNRPTGVRAAERMTGVRSAGREVVFIEGLRKE